MPRSARGFKLERPAQTATKRLQVRGLFIIFGAGFAAIYFVFAAMLWHAYRMREALGLSAFEIAYTRTSMVAQLLNVGVALLSMLVASVLTLGHSGAAGYVYLLLLPSDALWRRRRRSHEEDAAAARKSA